LETKDSACKEGYLIIPVPELAEGKKNPPHGKDVGAEDFQPLHLFRF
jgi:hypothetical protein